MRPKKISLDKIDSTKAFERHQLISEREKMRRRLFLENVKDLFEMYETQQYRPILGADDTASWEAYLAQIEVFYTRSQVHRWQKLWKTLVKDFKIDPLDFIDVPESRLEDIEKTAGTADQARELIDQARTVSTSRDWHDIICEKLGKPTTETCKHSFGIFRICGTCGLKHKENLGQDEHKDTEV